MTTGSFGRSTLEVHAHVNQNSQTQHEPTLQNKYLQVTPNYDIFYLSSCSCRNQ